jgi:hypothetical protein
VLHVCYRIFSKFFGLNPVQHQVDHNFQVTQVFVYPPALIMSLIVSQPCGAFGDLFNIPITL